MALPKACIVCGTVSDQTRCPAHRVKAWRNKDSPYDIWAKRARNSTMYKRQRQRMAAQAEAMGGFSCCWCGGWFPPEQLTADHDPPLASTYPEVHHNVVPACQGCNYGRTSNMNR